jgi:hypothetical protein
MDDPATPHEDTTHPRADDGAAEEVKLGVIDVVALNVSDARGERTAAHEGGEDMRLGIGEGDMAGPHARHSFSHMGKNCAESRRVTLLIREQPT